MDPRSVALAEGLEYVYPSTKVLISTLAHLVLTNERLKYLRDVDLEELFSFGQEAGWWVVKQDGRVVVDKPYIRQQPPFMPHPPVDIEDIEIKQTFMEWWLKNRPAFGQSSRTVADIAFEAFKKGWQKGRERNSWELDNLHEELTKFKEGEENDYS